MHFLFLVALVCTAVYTQTEDCMSCVRQRKQFGVTTENKIVCETKQNFETKLMKFVAVSPRTCARIAARMDPNTVPLTTLTPRSTADTTSVPVTLPTTEKNTVEATEEALVLPNTTTFSAILPGNGNIIEPTLKVIFPQDADNPTIATLDHDIEKEGFLDQMLPTLPSTAASEIIQKETPLNRLLRSMCRTYGLVRQYRQKYGNDNFLTKRVIGWNAKSTVANSTDLCASLEAARKQRVYSIAVNN